MRDVLENIIDLSRLNETEELNINNKIDRLDTVFKGIEPLISCFVKKLKKIYDKIVKLFYRQYLPYYYNHSLNVSRERNSNSHY